MTYEKALAKTLKRMASAREYMRFLEKIGEHVIMNSKKPSSKKGARKQLSKIARIQKLLDTTSLNDVAESAIEDYENAARYLARIIEYKRSQIEIQKLATGDEDETTQDEIR